MKPSTDFDWKKCKTCKNFTSNKSQICDICLQKKYKLLDMRRYVTHDCYHIVYIHEEDVLKLIDEFEAKNEN